MLRTKLAFFAIVVYAVVHSAAIICHGVFIRQRAPPRSLVPDHATKHGPTAEEKLVTDEINATKDMLNTEEKMAEAQYEAETGSHVSPVPDGPVPAPLPNGHGPSLPPSPGALQAQQNEKNYQQKMTKLEEDLKNQSSAAEATIQQDEKEVEKLKKQELEKELKAAGATPEEATAEAKSIVSGETESTSFIAAPVPPREYFGYGKLPDGLINARPDEKSPSQQYNEEKKKEALKAMEASNQREAQRKLAKKGGEDEED